MRSRRLDAACPILVLQKVDGNENFRNQQIAPYNTQHPFKKAPSAAVRNALCGAPRERENGDPCWDRTSDTLIKSQVLYQLS